jgi:hypothetical protein
VSYNLNTVVASDTEGVTVALICYIATLLIDERGLSETCVVTWTNIIVLLRFQLRTTFNK